MGNNYCWCWEPALENSKNNLCVLHAPNEEKEPLHFWRRFKELFGETLRKYEEAAAENKKDIGLNCYGFVFPTFGWGEFPEEVPFETSFLRAVFEYGADFSGVWFLEDVSFSGAYFGGLPTEAESIEKLINENYIKEISADFDNAKFEGLVMFNDAEFYCPVSFRNASFLNNIRTSAGFMNTKFYAEAVFSWSRFIQSVLFHEALFQGKTEFVETKFNGNVEFDWAVFNDKMIFNSTEFRKRVSLNETTIENKVSFFNIGSEFVNDERGRNVRDKQGYPIITNPRVELFLQYCDPKPGGKIELDRTSLKKVSFANTQRLEDFRIFDFKGAFWKNPEDKRKVVYDEILAGKEAGTPTYEETAEVYRRLRLNYESRLAYEFASDFHIGQMRMLFKSLRKRNPKKWFLWLYKYVSNFGESVGRPLLWFGGLWLIFAGIWFFKGFPYDTGSVNFDLTWPSSMSPDLEMAKDVGRSLLYSFKTFLTLPSLNEGVVSQTIGAVQRLAGASVITLFILALRRAFRR